MQDELFGLYRVRRRVGRIGSSKSFFVRTPRVYAEAVGWTAGAQVQLVYGLGRLLIVVPTGGEGELLDLLREGARPISHPAAHPGGTP